jgi:hypothetical protein
LGVYPIGSVVELNTGERGVVVATNRRVVAEQEHLLATGRAVFANLPPPGHGIGLAIDRGQDFARGKRRDPDPSARAGRDVECR